MKRSVFTQAENQLAIGHFRPADSKEDPSWDASVRFSTPRVLHLSGSSTLQRCNVTTGIICLLAGSAEDIREMELKLEAGEQQSRHVIALIRKYAGRRFQRHSSGGKTELMYGDQVLISAAYFQRGGSWISFPGGSMTDDQFIVREELAVRGTARCQYLVVVQQPKYSMLELCVNALIPGNIDLDAQARPVPEDQSVPTLLPMKGGWAVGGQLASRVLKLVTKYGNRYRNVSNIIRLE